MVGEAADPLASLTTGLSDATMRLSRFGEHFSEGRLSEAAMKKVQREVREM
jgi:hypothetical protein